MKKHLIKLVAAIALIAIIGGLVFSGCAKEEAVTEEWQWPETLKICSGSGAGLAAAVGWSTKMEEDTGMKIRVTPEDLCSLRISWVGQGLFFWTSSAAGEMSEVMEAHRHCATREGGPFQIRTAWAFGVVSAGFFVRGDSPIRTPSDIKPGAKIIEMPGGIMGTKAILAWAGLDMEDVTVVYVGSYGASCRFLAEGTGDVAFGFPTSPQVMEVDAAQHGIRWLPLNPREEPEAAKRFWEVVPTWPLGIHSGGVESAIGVWGIAETCLTYLRDDTDPELVYHVIKWLDENHDKFEDTHPWCKTMTLDHFMEGLEFSFVPVHDGAIRYLKEKGLWTAAHDARQAQNIELNTRYVDAYQTVIEMADEQKINVHPDSDQWIELWENYKKENNLHPFRFFIDIEELTKD